MEKHNEYFVSRIGLEYFSLLIFLRLLRQQQSTIDDLIDEIQKSTPEEIGIERQLDIELLYRYWEPLLKSQSDSDILILNNRIHKLRVQEAEIAEIRKVEEVKQNICFIVEQVLAVEWIGLPDFFDDEKVSDYTFKLLHLVASLKAFSNYIVSHDENTRTPHFNTTEFKIILEKNELTNTNFLDLMKDIVEVLELFHDIPDQSVPEHYNIFQKSEIIIFLADVIEEKWMEISNLWNDQGFQDYQI